MNCGLTSELSDADFLLSEFASALLVRLMEMAGTTKISSRKALPNLYEIKIGRDLIFSGPDEAVAFQKFLYWLLTKDRPLDLEELQKNIAPALAHEEERVHKLIEDLTKGGMSELGKKLKEFRDTRGSAIFMALKKTLESDHYRKAPNRITFNELLGEITKFEDLSDVTPPELIIAVNDYLLLRKELGA